MLQLFNGDARFFKNTISISRGLLQLFKALDAKHKIILEGVMEKAFPEELG